MRVKKLKEILKDLDDDHEIFIRNSLNIWGNISELDQVEKSTYGFFGSMLPCLILNSSVNVELNQDLEVNPYIVTNGERRNVK